MSQRRRQQRQQHQQTLVPSILRLHRHVGLRFRLRRRLLRHRRLGGGLFVRGLALLVDLRLQRRDLLAQRRKPRLVVRRHLRLERYVHGRLLRGAAVCAVHDLAEHLHAVRVELLPRGTAHARHG